MPSFAPPDRLPLILALLVALGGNSAAAAGLPDTVPKIKRGVVAVGTFMAVRAQRHELRGSGFVVGGNYVVTNAHVLAPKLDTDRRETHAVFIPKGGTQAEVRNAEVLKQDEAHDLCLLRVGGAALPSLSLGNSGEVREGETVAFTGFPILNALGLFAATHQGIVSAIAPVVIPVGSGRDLNPQVLKRLGEPFEIFQLDATAYPGNSGSPLFDPESGRVVGVINSVFVKRTKEVALTDPSGITYAIPVDHVRALLKQAGVKF
ncbi:MAG: serine protease [Chromatiaceae bacterium]